MFFHYFWEDPIDPRELANIEQRVKELEEQNKETKKDLGSARERVFALEERETELLEQLSKVADQKLEEQTAQKVTVAGDTLVSIL